MNVNPVNSHESRKIQRLDVETPLGVVHLAAFEQKPDHRSVIFGILSSFCEESVTADDLEESKEDPRPRFPKLDFDVNWTHSNGFCVVAFGERGSSGKLRIGVDLERYSPKRLHLAERFFSEEEALLVKSLMEPSTAVLSAAASSAAGDASGASPAEREFFRLWCRKEAYYKCVGGDFFEGTLRRNMLRSPLKVCTVNAGIEKSPAESAGDSLEVHFVDLDGAAVGAPMKAALCLAVSESYPKSKI